jgi:probable F420-dependent oxidoreductase
MHIGVLPPYRTGVVADPDWLVPFVQRAESVGFESFYAVEHVVVPAGYATRYPYSDTGRMPLPDDCPIPDPLDLLAFLAAHTSRIVLATGILVIPEHHPLALAKRLATLDAVSGGRLRLGVGVGWMAEELTALGLDPSTRGARTDEALDVLGALWSATDGPASFHGRFFDFDDVWSRPLPVQRVGPLGGVPIHIGGHSVAAARRAGRVGSGLQPLGLAGDELAARVADMRSAAVDAGRDPDSLELTLGGSLADCDEAAVHAARTAGATRLLLSSREGDLAPALDQLSACASRLGLSG